MTLKIGTSGKQPAEDPLIQRRFLSKQTRPALIVAAAFAPGAVVTAVARQADINTGLIYRWRREFAEAAHGFAEVVVAGPSSLPSHCEEPVIEVVIGGNAQVRIPGSVSPELAAAVVKALAGR
jgi:transposase